MSKCHEQSFVIQLRDNVSLIKLLILVTYFSYLTGMI
jgi:hypothetical protein